MLTWKVGFSSDFPNHEEKSSLRSWDRVFDPLPEPKKPGWVYRSIPTPAMP